MPVPQTWKAFLLEMRAHRAHQRMMPRTVWPAVARLRGLSVPKSSLSRSVKADRARDLHGAIRW